jgi:hypothetical protein
MHRLNPVGLGKTDTGAGKLQVMCAALSSRLVSNRTPGLRRLYPQAPGEGCSTRAESSFTRVDLKPGEGRRKRASAHSADPTAPARYVPLQRAELGVLAVSTVLLRREDRQRRLVAPSGETWVQRMVP